MTRTLTDLDEIKKHMEQIKQKQDTVVWVAHGSWCLGLKCEIAFGKYNGRILEDVINADPSYIAWQLKENDKFVISKLASDLLKSKGYEVSEEKYNKGY